MIEFTNCPDVNKLIFFTALSIFSFAALYIAYWLGRFNERYTPREDQ